MTSDFVKNINTEKTHNMMNNGVYVFLFQNDKRKNYIKSVIEKKYSVKVDKINILNIPDKKRKFRGIEGRLSRYKKVYVRVADGMKIDVKGGISGVENE